MISSGLLRLRVDHRSTVDGHVRLQAKYVVCVKLVSIVGTTVRCTTTTRYADEGYIYKSK